MKKTLLTLSVLAAGFSVSAQDATYENIDSKNNVIATLGDPYEGIDHTLVKYEAHFPDGHQKCLLYINKSFVFGDDILAVAPVNIKMVAKFIVETDGRLTSIQVERDERYDTAKQLIRILTAMPKWNPARDKDHRPVRSVFTLPVNLYVTKG